MDIHGLLPEFRLNRPLNGREIAGRLDQNVRLPFSDDELNPDGHVIKINSGYLELVDKYYASRGYVSFFFSGIFITFAVAYFIILLSELSYSHNRMDHLFTLVLFGILIIPLEVLFFKLLKTEWFARTHYPIRFDRKNQLVHVHRTDGSVFSVPWHEIYFTTEPDYHKRIMNRYYISGHILEKDTAIIKETFCLPASHSTLPPQR